MGLDAPKTACMLVRYHAGEAKVWSVVRIATVEEEDRRQLHRELRRLKKQRTRVRNRAQGLLANQGLWLPKGRDLTTFFAEIRLWDGSPVPAGLRARLQREWAHAQFYTQRSVNWSASDRRRSNTTAGRRSKK